MAGGGNGWWGSTRHEDQAELFVEDRVRNRPGPRRSRRERRWAAWFLAAAVVVAIVAGVLQAVL